MATALVIHAASDNEFVRSKLLAALPSLGFGAWTNQLKDQVGAVSMILVVVSKAAANSEAVRSETKAALTSGKPLIPVLTDDTALREIAPGLESRVTVDFRIEFADAYRDLAQSVPAVDASEASGSLGEWAQLLDWNETVFSDALAAALGRRDHTAAESLISAFEQHAATRSHPYGVNETLKDLKTLKKYRKFGLMMRLGSSALSTGTKGNGAVRKLYAQALIERRNYGEALTVLNDLLQDPDTVPYEINEAKGLTGRVYKQKYVNDPEGPDADKNIRRALDAYGDVYDQDPTQVWHGINTASCILRANRDGVSGVDPDRARRIAEEIVEHLAKQESAKGGLPIWDRATRVEALLVLERYGEAGKALDAYLYEFVTEDDSSPYPFFELAATQRQFAEVLELENDPHGRPLLAKLSTEVERYRSGSVLRPDSALDAGEGLEGAGPTPILPLLIRVADPAWKPQDNVPDLEITARLGTVVSATGTDATVQALLRDLDVISVEESYPAGTEECEKSVPFIGAQEVWQSEGEEGAGALVAVIDNGIDVMHKAFLDGQGASRIVEIWDQCDRSGPPPPDFNYGTHHSTADIAGYLNSQTPPELGRNWRGHGTHVASIAAGRKAGDFGGGVAPEAKLVIVKSAATEPVGYSRSHVDALAYIDRVARRLGLPVVVNLSQGMNAGAHDGKSTLEVAFNEFSGGGRKPGRVIVKSAGNERYKNGHAKVPLKPKSKEAIAWERSPQGGVGTERIELWWSSADEVEFRLRNPRKLWTKWVGADAEHEDTFADGDKYSLTHVRRHQDNGDSRLLIEITGRSGAPVEDGEWILEIRSGEVPLGSELHAWIERGPGTPSEFTKHANEEMTLSIPGTAEDVISVGAIKVGEFPEVGEFSSYGPTRDGRNKPEVAAPGIGIHAADGGTATGSRPESGTSMAAPHVTGAIALLLSKNPRLVASQVKKALWQNTRNFNGKWDPGQGWGIVDVKKLMAAF